MWGRNALYNAYMSGQRYCSMVKYRWYEGIRKVKGSAVAVPPYCHRPTRYAENGKDF
nr:MAG TPA: hypothetical protein [Caudoviricetes sp.]